MDDIKTYIFIKDWIKNPLYTNMIRIAEKMKKGPYYKNEVFLNDFSVYLKEFCKMNPNPNIIVKAIEDAILEGAKIKFKNNTLIFN